MKRLKAHCFRGKRYKIVWHKPKGCKNDPKNYERWAQCSPPWARGKRIMVWPKLKGFKLMHALVDEAIHACVWDLDNDAVDEISHDISKFLWRVGVRFEP
jgi:hypothetical protein